MAKKKKDVEIEVEIIHKILSIRDPGYWVEYLLECYDQTVYYQTRIKFARNEKEKNFFHWQRNMADTDFFAARDWILEKLKQYHEMGEMSRREIMYNERAEDICKKIIKQIYGYGKYKASGDEKQAEKTYRKIKKELDNVVENFMKGMI